MSSVFAVRVWAARSPESPKASVNATDERMIVTPLVSRPAPAGSAQAPPSGAAGRHSRQQIVEGEPARTARSLLGVKESRRARQQALRIRTPDVGRPLPDHVLAVDLPQFAQQRGQRVGLKVVGDSPGHQQSLAAAVARIGIDPYRTVRTTLD